MLVQIAEDIIRRILLSYVILWAAVFGLVWSGAHSAKLSLLRIRTESLGSLPRLIGDYWGPLGLLGAYWGLSATLRPSSHAQAPSRRLI